MCSMYVCMNMCMCVYMYLCMYIYIYIYIKVRMYVCIYVWLSAIKEEVELCENFEITYPGKAGTMQKRPS